MSSDHIFQIGAWITGIAFTAGFFLTVPQCTANDSRLYTERFERCVSAGGSAVPTHDGAIVCTAKGLSQ